MLTAADDGRHELRAPLGRESLFFGVALPEERAHVIVYSWVDSANVAGSFLLVYDHAGRQVYETASGVDMGAADFDDWQVGALTVRHTEPLRTAVVHFASDTAGCDLRFEGLHDAFAYSENAHGCPPCLADDRFEQSGHVTGTVTYGDRRLEVDAIGHRDHSWGVREWEAIQHYKWVSADAGPDLVLNALYFVSDGRLTVHGYVARGGEVTPIVRADAIVESDDDWIQRTGRLTLIDARDRSTEITFERFASTAQKTGTTTVLHECAATCEIDRQSGKLHLEMAWNRDYVAARRRSHEVG